MAAVAQFPQPVFANDAARAAAAPAFLGQLAVQADSGAVYQASSLAAGAWILIPFLRVAGNLSDLADAAAARTNLGLGNVANSLQLAAASNLSDLADAPTARTNLGLGTAATHAATDFDAAGAGAAAAATVDTALLAHEALTNNPHSVTKAQVGLGSVTNDAQLPLAGGTMSGNLAMGGHNISGAGTITATTLTGSLIKTDCVNSATAYLQLLESGWTGGVLFGINNDAGYFEVTNFNQTTFMQCTSEFSSVHLFLNRAGSGNDGYLRFGTANDWGSSYLIGAFGSDDYLRIYNANFGTIIHFTTTAITNSVPLILPVPATSGGNPTPSKGMLFFKDDGHLYANNGTTTYTVDATSSLPLAGGVITGNLTVRDTLAVGDVIGATDGEIGFYDTSLDAYLNVFADSGIITFDCSIAADTIMLSDLGSTFPSSPSVGQRPIVFVNGHFYGWNGSAWKQLDN